MGHRHESQAEDTPNSHGDAIEDWELEEVLDKALSQLNSGDDPEQILARFPAHAGLLRPMLRVAQWVRRVPPPAPDIAARQAGLTRLLAAVRAQRDRRVEALLDVALARLVAGEPADTILADYSTWANMLQPMLAAAITISETSQPNPDQQKKREGRERLLRAVEARQYTHAARATAGAFEDALDEALARLRQGVDVETILARYPAFAVQMHPLLRAAETVQHVPPPVPDEDAYFAGRQRVVRLAVEQRRQRLRTATPTARVPVTQSIGRILQGFLGVTPHLRRATITVVMLVVMILGSFSVTRVAADSLPTSPLYPVKRFSERVQLVLTPSTEAKAILHLRFSQERLREAETLARQTGTVHSAVLGDMLEQNDQFLGTIKQISPEKREELLASGARVFFAQRQVLTELSRADGLLSPLERAALTDFVGEAGDDEAIAEEAGEDVDLAEFIPTPTPIRLATITPRPSPTPAPATVQAPARPTSAPATATLIPPSATPSQAPAEVVLEPAGPDALSTATGTATVTAAPTATPTATSTFAPAATAEPREPTATPISEPPATPTAAEPVVEPSATSEIVLPTLPPPEPVPSTTP
ncbi:MAG: DUF5667 domain-containing protein [Anaerolineae bacterium]